MCFIIFKKRTLLETNIYLLALTIVITLVHNVFEFLAFKNGINMIPFFIIFVDN